MEKLVRYLDENIIVQDNILKYKYLNGEAVDLQQLRKNQLELVEIQFNEFLNEIIDTETGEVYKRFFIVRNRID